MLCSTIIPTINRPSLERAVKSVLNQDLDPRLHEVIVVNDSGKPLSETDWFESPQITIVNTNRCERSWARNTGAAVASGKYLHFLDDDDYLHPGGLRALLEVAEVSDCAWIYGAHDRVDNDDRVMSINRPEIKGNIFALLVAGESIHLGPSLIARETFHQCGGFDLHLSVQEDRDLGCRLAFLSDVDRTDYLVSSVRIGHDSSSSDWSQASHAGRAIREKMLDVPDVHKRLTDSIDDNVRLRGRIGRAYAISCILNLSDRHVLRSASRFLAFFRTAGIYIFTPNFWRGMTFKSHWHSQERQREDAHFEAQYAK